jgi:hypothetical protein
LADTSERETDAATSRHGPVLLPVLARRAHEVDHAVKVTFPHVTYRRPSISDEAGWVAGRAAGQSALLSLDSEVVPGLTA